MRKKREPGQGYESGNEDDIGGKETEENGGEGQEDQILCGTQK